MILRCLRAVGVVAGVFSRLFHSSFHSITVMFRLAINRIKRQNAPSNAIQLDGFQVLGNKTVFGIIRR